MHMQAKGILTVFILYDSHKAESQYSIAVLAFCFMAVRL